MDILYMFLLQNAVHISYHVYSHMIKKMFPVMLCLHKASLQFSACALLVHSRFHALYQILFVYTPVIQVPTVTLFIRSSFRFTSSLSIRSWCTLHFSFCVYKPDTHVLSTFTVSIDSWYTRPILLAVSRHSWYTSFFLIFLSIRRYSYILFCSGVPILRW
jgi:hypothetical protein